MAALVIPNGGQLSLVWAVGSERSYNVLGLNVSPGGVFDQTTANAFGAVVSSAFTSSSIAASIDAGTALTAVAIRDLRVANMAEIGATFTPMFGTAVGDKLSNATAAVYTLRTAKAGKSYRGRVYLPIDGAGARTGDTQAYSTAAYNAGDAFLAAIKTGIDGNATLAGQFHLAVLSRELLLSTIVVDIVSRSPVFGSQRRRIPKRG